MGINNPNIKGASAQTTFAAITAPTSTVSYTMGGLGLLIKPLRSGIIFATFCATIADTSSLNANTGIGLNITYGTGSAPVNGAALTGTQTQETFYTSPVAPAAAADVAIPCSKSYLINGLIIGTQYWFDISQVAFGAASQYKFTFGNLILFEL